MNMASNAAEPDPPIGVVADDTENQQNGGPRSGREQQSTAHMQGWALASLACAFMAMCFTLALDNTILGSQAHPPYEGL